MRPGCASPLTGVVDQQDIDYYRARQAITRDALAIIGTG